MFRIDDEGLLLKKLKEGSKEAFRELYTEFYTKLCLYITFFTRNENKSEDIVQEVMTKIWEKRAEIQITGKLKNYLYRASYNEFLNIEKRRKKFSFLEELAIEAYEELEEEDHLYPIKLQIIRDEVQKLPPKCREVFIKVKMEGKKYIEVAEELKISPKTVEIHMGNALKRIREAVKK